MKCFLSICFIFTVFNLIAQTSRCGTTPSKYIDYDTILNQPVPLSNLPDRYCVEVKFHILQDYDGTSVFPSSDLDGVVDNLNIAFNQHNIFFRQKSVNFIARDRYPKLNIDLFTIYPGDYSVLFGTDDDPNALNIYIIKELFGFGGSSLAGVAPNIPSTKIAVEEDDVESSTTVHEVGHAFGLYHTHETEEFGTENIERSGPNANCDNAGDQFCSTAADPKLFENEEYEVDSGCNYTGNETHEGIPYDPDTDNFMSYTREICRDNFTQEQGDMMFAFIQSSIPPFIILNSITSSNCSYPTISGSSYLCFGEEATYSLENFPTNAVVTWSSSGDLDFNGSTVGTSTVEVEVNGLTNATLTAEFNGYEVEKSVNIGNIDLSDVGLNAPYQIEVNTFSPINVVGNIPTASGYHWEISPLDLPGCSESDFGTDSNGNSITSIDTDGGSVDVEWGNCGASYFITCWVDTNCGRQKLGKYFAEVKEAPDCVEVNASPNPFSPYIAVKMGVRLIYLPECDEHDPPGDGGGDLPEPGTPGTVSIFNLQGGDEFTKDVTLNESHGVDIPSDVMNSLTPATYILNLNVGEGEAQEVYTTKIVVSE